MPEDFGSLKGGGDCQDHYHNSDRYPTRDSLQWLHSLENVTNVATNTTLTYEHDIIVITTASTVTLPASRRGKIFVITSNVAGVSTIALNGTETISGVAASKTFSGVGSVVRLKAVTGGWVTI